MTGERPGKVYLVGAGPGDPGLVTWRAMEVLERADVVFVDALVDPILVATLPEHVQRFYVGKRAGHHSVPQRDIESRMIEQARLGHTVVRLKGGDPFVFGRGGEEAKALHDAGIPFEVVPGVTAAIAASAYAGIPVTQRGLSCFSLLFTAHEAPDKPSSCGARMPYEAIARLKGGTLAGYMAVSRLPRIAEKLISEGMDPATPAALIERGATPCQRVVTAPLSELPEAAKRENIQPPSLFVIGDVVNMREQLDWYHVGPLAGKRVLVTRPTDQAEPLYEALRRQGMYVIPGPTIRTTEVFDLDLWNETLAPTPEGGWIVFTSQNSVRYFLSGLFRSGHDLRWLGNWKLAGMGTGTAQALQAVGLTADWTPSSYTTESLAEELPEHIASGSRVIRVRGNLAASTVEDALADAGAEVTPLEVYRTETAPLEDIVRAWVEESPLDAAVFTSGSTFTSFLEQWGDRGREILAETAVISMGPHTSGIMRDAGVEPTVEAVPHNIEGLVGSLSEYLAAR